MKTIILFFSLLSFSFASAQYLTPEQFADLFPEVSQMRVVEQGESILYMHSASADAKYVRKGGAHTFIITTGGVVYSIQGDGTKFVFSYDKKVRGKEKEVREGIQLPKKLLNFVEKKKATEMENFFSGFPEKKDYDFFALEERDHEFLTDRGIETCFFSKTSQGRGRFIINHGKMKENEVFQRQLEITDNEAILYFDGLEIERISKKEVPQKILEYLQ